MTRYRVWRIRINLIAMSTTGEAASIMAEITNMYRKEDYGVWGWRRGGLSESVEDVGGLRG